MIPKKPKEIIRQTAEELDIPQLIVDDIVSSYYKSLRKHLSSMDNLNITVPGLGRFIVKHSGVNKAIKKYESMNKNMTDNFHNYHNKRIVLERLEKLYQVKEKIKKFLETKKQFKDLKYGKYIKADMGKPEADS
jgi:hypothetical protein